MMIYPACIYVLLAHFAAAIASASDAEPVIHPVPLQNGTSVPEELGQLPLVGKCCPLNKVLVRDANGTSACVYSNDSSKTYFSPQFHNFNQTGVSEVGNESNEFVAVVGNPCQHQMFMLSPEEETTGDDEYFLLSNGTIFAPQYVPSMLTPGEDYCMEVVPEFELRVFVCFPEEINVVIVTANSQIIIYACGLLISVPFLILTIAAYMITPKLRDVYGKALCNYCGCLALAFIGLAIAQLASEQLPSEICISIAFVIQFSFVACFFWLNVMCIETWLLVRHHVNHRAYARIKPKTMFFYYSIWAWSPPAILILISMTMDLSPMIPMTYVKPTFGAESCWFKSDEEAMPYFYVPVGILLLVNVILFTITAFRISRYQHELAQRRRERNQYAVQDDRRVFRRLNRTFIVCLLLFFLMGLNWTMELISWWAGGDPMEWSAFDLVNALQGILIFGLFVLRRPARNLVWHRIQRLRGIRTTEPQIGSMDLTLLPMMNGDSLPRQTIIQ